MKKWLSFFAAAVLATGPVANVISCDKIDVYNVIRLDMMSKRIFDMLITDEYDDSNDVIADRGEDDQVVGQDGIGPELWFYRAIAHVFETSKYRMTIPELKKELSFQFFDINGKPVDGQELNLKIEFSFIATATSTSTKFIGQTVFNYWWCWSSRSGLQRKIGGRLWIMKISRFTRLRVFFNRLWRYGRQTLQFKL